MKNRATTATADSGSLLLSVIEHIMEPTVICLMEGFHILYANNAFRQRFPQAGGDLLNVIPDQFHLDVIDAMQTPGPWRRRISILPAKDTVAACFELCGETLGGQMVMMRFESCGELHGSRSSPAAGNSTGDKGGLPSAELEAFAYIASHDLHEPLRKISTFGQRLALGAQHELSARNMDNLDRMLKATDNMRQLLDNLLEFSRVARDSGAFVKQDLGVIIAEVLLAQELRIEETGAKVEVDPMPEMEVEPSQMRQLFNNLLGNALKFIRKDVRPEVRISCRKVTPDEHHHYDLSAGREYYRISVVDNGVGFENRYANKIFQVFQRLHGRSEYAGTGIGLAICRKIAENHEGLIFADSEPGKGSSFTILLPNKH